MLAMTNNPQSCVSLFPLPRHCCSARRCILLRRHQRRPRRARKRMPKRSPRSRSRMVETRRLTRQQQMELPHRIQPAQRFVCVSVLVCVCVSVFVCVCVCASVDAGRALAASPPPSLPLDLFVLLFFPPLLCWRRTNCNFFFFCLF